MTSSAGRTLWIDRCLAPPALPADRIAYLDMAGPAALLELIPPMSTRGQKRRFNCQPFRSILINRHSRTVGMSQGATFRLKRDAVRPLCRTATDDASPGASGPPPPLADLLHPQIFRRFLAAVRDGIERHLGAIRQAVQAGLLDCRNMDENVLAAAIRPLARALMLPFATKLAGSIANCSVGASSRRRASWRPVNTASFNNSPQ
jgi:hypothetical protein